MKRKKINKKLNLKKMTVANLNPSQLKKARGGDETEWNINCHIFSVGLPTCNTFDNNNVTCGNRYTCEPKKICVGQIDPFETVGDCE